MFHLNYISEGELHDESTPFQDSFKNITFFTVGFIANVKRKTKLRQKEWNEIKYTLLLVFPIDVCIYCVIIKLKHVDNNYIALFVFIVTWIFHATF